MSFAQADQAALDLHDFKFDLCFERVGHNDIKVREDLGIYVLPMLFWSGLRCFSDMEPEKLEDYVRDLPEPKRAAGGDDEDKPPKPVNSIPPELLAKCGWLARVKPRQGDGGGGGHDSGNGESRRPPPKDKPVLEIPEDEMEQAVIEIVDAKLAELDGIGPTSDIIIALPRGAPSNKKKEGGKAIDSWRAEPVDSDGVKFSKKYGFKLSFSCMLDAYDWESCRLLTRAWAHKVNYFFRLSEASGDAMYRFSQAEIDAYDISTEFNTFVASLAPNAKAWGRVRQIEQVQPKEPIVVT